MLNFQEGRLSAQVIFKGPSVLIEYRDGGGGFECLSILGQGTEIWTGNTLWRLTSIF